MEYLNIFFFYSIVGYLLESFFLKDYISGLLYLPWTPIYGLGILIAIYIYNQIKKRFSLIIELILHFILCAIILSVIEFIGGSLIELLFHKIYWNYDPLKYNFGKYISLESAFIWGIGSTLIVYLINPLIKKILIKIPKIWTKLLTVIFIIDIIITFLVKMPLS